MNSFITYYKKIFNLLIFLSLVLSAPPYSLAEEKEINRGAVTDESSSNKFKTETLDLPLNQTAWGKPGEDYKWIPMWIKDSPLTIPRASPAVAVADGFIYVIGGGSFKNDHIFYSSVEYTKILPDGSLAPWLQTSPMNTKRMFAAAVIANGYIYVIGGEKGTDESKDLLQTIERAKILPDGSLGKWIIETYKMNTNRRALVASYYKGWIYAFGGYNGSFLKDMERCKINQDGSLQKWILEGEEAKNARYIHSGVIYKNFIYLFGGHAMSFEKATNTAEWTTIYPDGKLGVWQNLPEMSTNRFAGGAIILRDRVYLIGGQNTITLTAVEQAPISEDGNLGKWLSDTPLPLGRVGAGLAVWNDVVYIIGGTIGKQYLREILRGHYIPGKKLGAWINDPELISKAEEIANKPPLDASKHVHRGWKKFLAKQYDEAIVELKFAIKAKADYGQSHNLLGVVYQAKKMYHEAISHYLKSIELSPNYFQPYYQLGKLYHEIILMNRAEDMYRKAIALKPELIQAKISLFYLFIETKRCEEAKSQLGLIVQDNFNNGLHQVLEKHCK